MSSTNRQIIFKVVKGNNIVSYTKEKEYWSQAEDTLLLRLIDDNTKKGNKIKWKDITCSFDKCYQQCYSRYRQINPLLNKGN